MNYISELLNKFEISASADQVADFEKWLVNLSWSKYCDDRMNKRIIVENQVKALPGLRLMNGTVNKEYFGKIEIPAELVDDVWIDGLDRVGLKSDVLDHKPDHKPELELPAEEPKTGLAGEPESVASEILADTIVFSPEETRSEIAEEAEITEITEKADECKPEKYIIQITGIPSEAGDFTLKLNFKHKGWLEGEEVASIQLPIAFNQDPRSLWKNIPTSEGIIYYKQDSEVAYVKVEENEVSGPRKDMVAASQRGRSHAQEGKPRDDHFKLYHCAESDWYIIAVADGAGSAQYSRKGSEVACETVVNYCKEQLQNCPVFEEKISAYKNAENEIEARKLMANEIYKIIGNAAFKSHKNLKDLSDVNPGTKLKDFATTLMFAICKKFEFGWFIASYWVGDGAMCVLNKEKKEFKLLGIPDEGEYSGQTRFITMPEIFKDAKSVMDRLRFSIEDDFTALMLLTDGVSDAMFETENNLKSYDKWAEFWDKLKTGFPEDEIPGVDLTDDNEDSKNQLLNWLDFWSSGNHDDRTIAILY